MDTEQRLEPVGIICEECGVLAIDNGRGWHFCPLGEVLPCQGHNLRRQLSREGAARNRGSMSALMAPTSAPRESAALQEKSTTAEGPRLWVRRWARVPPFTRVFRNVPRAVNPPRQGKDNRGATLGVVLGSVTSGCDSSCAEDVPRPADRAAGPLVTTPQPCKGQSGFRTTSASYAS